MLFLFITFNRALTLYISGSAVAQSVVECLTRDRGVVGSSLTSVTVLWSLNKTHLSLLSTGSIQEDLSCLTERLLMGGKESNQTNYIFQICR